MENEHHLFQNKSNNDLPIFYLISEKGLFYLFFRKHNHLFTHEDLNNTFNDIVKLKKFKDISKQLVSLGHMVKFIATDGDKTFNVQHENWFLKVEKVFSMDCPFNEKINLLKDETEIPISDPFHLLKNARCHLLNHSILLDSKTMRWVNMALFE